MGSSPDAHIGYGFDLGYAEDFNAAERDEYGSPDLPWFDEEEDDGLSDKAEKLLLVEVAGFTETDWRADGYYERKRAAEARVGVEFIHSGGLDGDYSGWVLVATGSHRSVEWSETMALDVDSLRDDPAANGWDEKLAGALKALGITPTQDGAKWLVFPSYG